MLSGGAASTTAPTAAFAADNVETQPIDVMTMEPSKSPPARNSPQVPSDVLRSQYQRVSVSSAEGQSSAADPVKSPQVEPAKSKSDEVRGLFSKEFCFICFECFKGKHVIMV